MTQVTVRPHRAASRAAAVGFAVAMAALLGIATGVAGQPVPRILAQDPTLDNLVDPPGYQTAEVGTLGAVTTVGSGPGTMVLVPGFGFGGDVFGPITEGRESAYTMYEVTLAGFGGTAAPSAPAPGTSFGDQTWTNGATSAVEKLLVERDLRDVVLVGHWLGGTQIALQLAHRQPSRVRAVILLSGSPRWVPAAPAPVRDVPLDARVTSVDTGAAPTWFKTVTRETWDDNNFLPGDYAENPILGLLLWREAARPPLHGWVRYLCEFLAQDATLELDGLDVPMLVLHPGLERLYHEKDNNYVDAYARRSWGETLSRVPTVTVDTIPDTRIVMWYDRPDAVNEAIDAFLSGLG